MPATVNWLAPGTTGTRACQEVTPVQVTGQAMPLNRMVWTPMGAVPVMVTRLLAVLRLLAGTVKLAATVASWLMM